LQYPVFEPDVKTLAWLNSVKAPVWAIIHSQPVDEVLALYDHACDMSVYELEPPQICVFTFEQLSVNHPVFTIYPVWPLLPYFSRVFMACGFNSLNQTAKYKTEKLLIIKLYVPQIDIITVSAHGQIITSVVNNCVFGIYACFK